MAEFWTRENRYGRWEIKWHGSEHPYRITYETRRDAEEKAVELAGLSTTAFIQDWLDDPLDAVPNVSSW